MDCVGRDFRERREDETARSHGGMWDGKRGCVENLIAEQKDIEIDNARAFGLGATASHGFFYGKQRRHELGRGSFGIEGDGGVEKPGLIGEVDRLGLVERGDGGELTQGTQPGDGVAKVMLTITEV